MGEGEWVATRRNPHRIFFNFSHLAPDIQTHQFPSIPSSSTQNLLSLLTTEHHAVPTPLQRTSQACPNMNRPREPNVDDGDDDADDDDDDESHSESSGSQFMDMSSTRVARRRNLGLRSRVHVHRPCDT